LELGGDRIERLGEADDFVGAEVFDLFVAQKRDRGHHPTRRLE